MRDERGAVTAETALVLPVLVAIGLVMVWLVSLGLTQMRVVDGAREAARSAARGDGIARAESLARTAVPGATVSIEIRGDVVHVRVERAVRPPGGVLRELLGDTGSATLSAESEGLVEGVSGADGAGP